MSKGALKRDILILIPVFYTSYLFLSGGMSDTINVLMSGHFGLMGNIGETFEEIFYGTFLIDVVLLCFCIYFLTKSNEFYPEKKKLYRKVGILFIFLFLLKEFVSTGLLYITLLMFH